MELLRFSQNLGSYSASTAELDTWGCFARCSAEFFGECWNRKPWAGERCKLDGAKAGT
jgi:hypothetical protein